MARADIELRSALSELDSQINNLIDIITYGQSSGTYLDDITETLDTLQSQITEYQEKRGWI